MWEKFLSALLDATIDTLKLVPLLFLVYFLIEILEYKNVFKFEKSNLLKGKYSSILGGCFGSIPQCSFSVISAELFAEKKISAAALVAVFIATSDEAFPLMIADYHSIPSLLLLIAIKLVFAILVGYLTYFLCGKVFNKKLFNENNQKNANISLKAEKNAEINSKNNNNTKTQSETQNNPQEPEKENHIHACCHHDVENDKFDFTHPLIHCAKISLYIFLVNLIIGTIVSFVGEENLLNFLSSSKNFQPLFATLVGLIPNCAASVVLTELYMMGGLSFGSIIAGLSVNAGLGILVLFKKNKNIKQNIFIFLMVLLPSLILGYALHFVPFDFLRI